MRASSSAMTLIDCKNLDIDRVLRRFNGNASFNYMTHIRERFTNRRLRVLQPSLEVSDMAISSMTFSDTDEKITLKSSLSNRYQCKYAGAMVGAAVWRKQFESKVGMAMFHL